MSELLHGRFRRPIQIITLLIVEFFLSTSVDISQAFAADMSAISSVKATNVALTGMTESLREQNRNEMARQSNLSEGQALNNRMDPLKQLQDISMKNEFNNLRQLDQFKQEIQQVLSSTKQAMQFLNTTHTRKKDGSTVTTSHGHVMAIDKERQFDEHDRLTIRNVVFEYLDNDNPNSPMKYYKEEKRRQFEKVNSNGIVTVEQSPVAIVEWRDGTYDDDENLMSYNRTDTDEYGNNKETDWEAGSYDDDGNVISFIENINDIYGNEKTSKEWYGGVYDDKNNLLKYSEKMTDQDGRVQITHWEAQSVDGKSYDNFNNLLAYKKTVTDYKGETTTTKWKGSYYFEGDYEKNDKLLTYEEYVEEEDGTFLTTYWTAGFNLDRSPAYNSDGDVLKYHKRKVYSDKPTEIEIWGDVGSAGDAGYVTEVDFTYMRPNASRFWRELIKSGYIAENGYILDKYKNLRNYSELELSSTYKKYASIVYNILNTALYKTQYTNGNPTSYKIHNYKINPDDKSMYDEVSTFYNATYDHRDNIRSYEKLTLTDSTKVYNAKDDFLGLVRDKTNTVWSELKDLDAKLAYLISKGLITNKDVDILTRIFKNSGSLISNASVTNDSYLDYLNLAISELEKPVIKGTNLDVDIEAMNVEDDMSILNYLVGATQSEVKLSELSRQEYVSYADVISRKMELLRYSNYRDQKLRVLESLQSFKKNMQKIADDQTLLISNLNGNDSQIVDVESGLNDKLMNVIGLNDTLSYSEPDVDVPSILRNAISNVNKVSNKFVRSLFSTDLNKYLDEKFNEYRFLLYKQSELKLTEDIWNELVENPTELLVYLQAQDLNQYIKSPDLKADINDDFSVKHADKYYQLLVNAGVVLRSEDFVEKSVLTQNEVHQKWGNSEYGELEEDFNLLKYNTDLTTDKAWILDEKGNRKELIKDMVNNSSRTANSKDSYTNLYDSENPNSEAWKKDIVNGKLYNYVDRSEVTYRAVDGSNKIVSYTDSEITTKILSYNSEDRLSGSKTSVKETKGIEHPVVSEYENTKTLVQYDSDDRMYSYHEEGISAEGSSYVTDMQSIIYDLDGNRDEYYSNSVSEGHETQTHRFNIKYDGLQRAVSYDEHVVSDGILNITKMKKMKYDQADRMLEYDKENSSGSSAGMSVERRRNVLYDNNDLQLSYQGYSKDRGSELVDIRWQATGILEYKNDKGAIIPVLDADGNIILIGKDFDIDSLDFGNLKPSNLVKSQFVINDYGYNSDGKILGSYETSLNTVNGESVQKWQGGYVFNAGEKRKDRKENQYYQGTLIHKANGEVKENKAQRWTGSYDDRGNKKTTQTDEYDLKNNNHSSGLDVSFPKKITVATINYEPVRSLRTSEHKLVREYNDKGIKTIDTVTDWSGSYHDNGLLESYEESTEKLGEVDEVVSYTGPVLQQLVVSLRNGSKLFSADDFIYLKNDPDNPLKDLAITIYDNLLNLDDKNTANNGALTIQSVNEQILNYFFGANSQVAVTAKANGDVLGSLGGNDVDVKDIPINAQITINRKIRLGDNKSVSFNKAQIDGFITNLKSGSAVFKSTDFAMIKDDIDSDRYDLARQIFDGLNAIENNDFRKTGEITQQDVNNLILNYLFGKDSSLGDLGGVGVATNDIAADAFFSMNKYGGETRNIQLVNRSNIQYKTTEFMDANGNMQVIPTGLQDSYEEVLEQSSSPEKLTHKFRYNIIYDKDFREKSYIEDSHDYSVEGAAEEIDRWQRTRAENQAWDSEGNVIKTYTLSSNPTNTLKDLPNMDRMIYAINNQARISKSLINQNLNELIAAKLIVLDQNNDSNVTITDLGNDRDALFALLTNYSEQEKLIIWDAVKVAMPSPATFSFDEEELGLLSVDESDGLPLGVGISLKVWDAKFIDGLKFSYNENNIELGTTVTDINYNLYESELMMNDMIDRRRAFEADFDLNGDETITQADIDLIPAQGISTQKVHVMNSVDSSSRSSILYNDLNQEVAYEESSSKAVKGGVTEQSSRTNITYNEFQQMTGYIDVKSSQGEKIDNGNLIRVDQSERITRTGMEYNRIGQTSEYFDVKHNIAYDRFNDKILQDIVETTLKTNSKYGKTGTEVSYDEVYRSSAQPDLTKITVMTNIENEKFDRQKSFHKVETKLGASIVSEIDRSVISNQTWLKGLLNEEAIGKLYAGESIDISAALLAWFTTWLQNNMTDNKKNEILALVNNNADNIATQALNATYFPVDKNDKNVFIRSVGTVLASYELDGFVLPTKKVAVELNEVSTTVRRHTDYNSQGQMDAYIEDFIDKNGIESHVEKKSIVYEGAGKEIGYLESVNKYGENYLDVALAAYQQTDASDLKTDFDLMRDSWKQLFDVNTSTVEGNWEPFWAKGGAFDALSSSNKKKLLEGKLVTNGDDSFQLKVVEGNVAPLNPVIINAEEYFDVYRVTQSSYDLLSTDKEKEENQDSRIQRLLMGGSLIKRAEKKASAGTFDYFSMAEWDALEFEKKKEYENIIAVSLTKLLSKARISNNRQDLTIDRFTENEWNSLTKEEKNNFQDLGNIKRLVNNTDGKLSYYTIKEWEQKNYSVTRNYSVLLGDYTSPTEINDNALLAQLSSVAQNILVKNDQVAGQYFWNAASEIMLQLRLKELSYSAEDITKIVNLWSNSKKSSRKVIEAMNIPGSVQTRKVFQTRTLLDTREFNTRSGVEYNSLGQIKSYIETKKNLSTPDLLTIDRYSDIVYNSVGQILNRKISSRRLGQSAILVNATPLASIANMLAPDKVFILNQDGTVIVTISDIDDLDALIVEVNSDDNTNFLTNEVVDSEGNPAIKISVIKKSVDTRIDTTDYTDRNETIYNLLGQERYIKEDTYGSSSPTIKTTKAKKQISYDVFGRERSYIEQSLKQGETTQSYYFEGQGLKDYLLTISERMQSASSFSVEDFLDLGSKVRSALGDASYRSIFGSASGISREAAIAELGKDMYESYYGSRTSITADEMKLMYGESRFENVFGTIKFNTFDFSHDLIKKMMFYEFLSGLNEQLWSQFDLDGNGRVDALDLSEDSLQNLAVDASISYETIAIINEGSIIDKRDINYNKFGQITSYLETQRDNATPNVKKVTHKHSIDYNVFGKELAYDQETFKLGTTKEEIGSFFMIPAGWEELYDDLGALITYDIDEESVKNHL